MKKNFFQLIKDQLKHEQKEKETYRRTEKAQKTCKCYFRMTLKMSWMIFLKQHVNSSPIYTIVLVHLILDFSLMQLTNRGCYWDKYLTNCKQHHLGYTFIFLDMFLDSILMRVCFPPPTHIWHFSLHENQCQTWICHCATNCTWLNILTDLLLLED